MQNQITKGSHVSAVSTLFPGDKIRIRPETYKSGMYQPRNNQHGTVVRQKDYSRAYLIQLDAQPGAKDEAPLVELFADEVFLIG